MSYSLNTPKSVQYDRRLVLAIELSSKFWVLAAQVPGLPQSKTRNMIAPDKPALETAIDGYRTRAAAAGSRVDRVIAIYEAGWCGFWLARCVRERTELISERIGLTSRIGAVWRH